MTAITFELESLPEKGPFSLSLHVETVINITAGEARRQVGVYAGNEISDLLTGDKPSLLWQHDKAYWRVPIVLTSRSWGRIGVVGAIDVDVSTGELQVTGETLQEIEESAGRFAIAAGLNAQ